MFSNHSKPPQYLAYLLRMWEARSECSVSPSVWRFSLENAQTKQRHTFANLQAVMAFLQTEMDQSRDAG